MPGRQCIAAYGLDHIKVNGFKASYGTERRACFPFRSPAAGGRGPAARLTRMAASISPGMTDVVLGRVYEALARTCARAALPQV